MSVADRVSDPAHSASRPLRQFLLNAAALSDPAYADYVEALPQPFKQFPESVETSKRRILIDQQKITFTKESFDDLADEAELPALFVTKNIESFLDKPDIFALDDEFLENVLQMGITDGQKASVIGLMDLGSVVKLPERAALLGPIMDRINSNMSKLNADVAKSLIAHSAPVSTRISILNKVNAALTDEEVREILSDLPLPCSEIKLDIMPLELTTIPRTGRCWSG